MLAPGDGTDHLQVIDARDVAQFTLKLIENHVNGVFNLAGPRLTWAAFIKILGVRKVVWVSKEIIKTAGVTEFELPLFRPDGAPRKTLDGAPLRALGWSPRHTLEEALAATYRWFVDLDAGAATNG